MKEKQKTSTRDSRSPTSCIFSTFFFLFRFEKEKERKEKTPHDSFPPHRAYFFLFFSFLFPQLREHGQMQFSPNHNNNNKKRRGKEKKFLKMSDWFFF